MSDIQSEDNLIFDGRNGVTSDAFLRHVRRRSIVLGSQRDDQLVADIAASYLGGQALHWYESQDQDTQESWKLLRRAILIRWPADTETSSATVPTGASSSSADPSGIPTPAAAPPPAASPSIARFNPITNGVKSGRIQVLADDNSSLGFVSRSLSEGGNHLTTTNLADAMLVHYTPSRDFHEVIIENSTFGVPPRMLGMRWNKVDNLQKVVLDGLQSRWGGLTTVSRTIGSGQLTSSSTYYQGIICSSMWHVLSDGAMVAAWEVKPRIHCTLTITISSGILSLTSDYDLLMKQNPTFTIAKARFQFQEL